MKPKYEIEQRVFFPQFHCHTQESVVCPDCGGTGRLRVTFHDETTVSIPCENCSRGYEPPTGKILVYCAKGQSIEGTISGIETTNHQIEYWISYYHVGEKEVFKTRNLVKEENVFLSNEDAQLNADKLASEYEQEERAKIFRKQKDTKSWAWNASYHRKEIKDAERKLEHHRSKLSYAAIKAKETK